MPGAPDLDYIRARRALLDGLTALRPHLDSIVVVGAQALYLHTGPSEMRVAESTVDADLAIAPEFLAATPCIVDLLEAHGFVLQGDPGRWRTADRVQVDLLVPDAVAGAGRRGAHLTGHGRHAARRSRGIEGALVDRDSQDLGAFDPADLRTFRVAVAGPAALFVAKVHKIADRVEMPDRLVDKDPLDVLRLLMATPAEVLAGRLRWLAGTEVAGQVTVEAIDLAGRLLADRSAPGARLAARAVVGLEDPDIIAASLAALSRNCSPRSEADHATFCPPVAT